MVYNLTAKQKKAKQKFCFALDNINSLRTAENRLKEMIPFVDWVRISMSSYLWLGPKIIDKAKNFGLKVFFDTKLHDKPELVKNFARAVSELNVNMYSIHASGGVRMIQSAREETYSVCERNGYAIPKMIAVTVPTSMTRNELNNELKVFGSLENHVLNLTRLAYSAGLDGIICSPTQIFSVKNGLPAKFIFVTPGIKSYARKHFDDSLYQESSSFAIEEGSSLVVIGNLINKEDKAVDRIRVAKNILDDMTRYI